MRPTSTPGPSAARADRTVPRGTQDSAPRSKRGDVVRDELHRRRAQRDRACQQVVVHEDLVAARLDASMRNRPSESLMPSRSVPSEAESRRRSGAGRECCRRRRPADTHGDGPARSHPPAPGRGGRGGEAGLSRSARSAVEDFGTRRRSLGRKDARAAHQRGGDERCRSHCLNMGEAVARLYPDSRRGSSGQRHAS